jgi:hypothetical protein
MAVFDWRKAHDARLRDQESRRDDPSWPCLGRKPGDFPHQPVDDVPVGHIRTLYGNARKWILYLGRRARRKTRNRCAISLSGFATATQPASSAGARTGTQAYCNPVVGNQLDCRDGTSDGRCNKGASGQLA